MEKKLNSLPMEFCDELPSMYFVESALNDVVRKVGKSIFLNNNGGRKCRMDGLIALGGLFGGIRMVYNNKTHKLTELEKEWVVLNYNDGIEELFSKKKYANLENEIANKMEDLEKKYFSAMAVKVQRRKEKLK